MRTDRRGFLGAGAAAAAAGLAGRAEDAEAAKRRKRKPAPAKTRKADVVVVGAGFAGLTAAYRIMQAGRSVVVLEARRRVGGRVDAHHLDGGVISEAGGTFVGPTQDHVINLGKELGVGTFETYANGANVYVRNGRRSTYSDTGPTGTAPPDAEFLPDLATVVTQLNEMSKTVPVDAPWDAASAGVWDAQTLDSWIRDNIVNPNFRQLVPLATRPIFGVEGRDLSLLFVLFYIAASGDERNVGTFERNFNTRNGAQMYRFTGGSQLLPERMAKSLGKRVVLGTPVRRIVQSGSTVKAVGDALNVTAKHAVVAVPPVLANRIDFDPALPSDREQLGQRISQGYLGKVACVYEKPFWRDAGLSGSAASLDGFVTFTVDDSPPDAKVGIVFGFVGGEKLRPFQALSPNSRRAAVLAEFTQLFGAEAAKPKDYFETFWPEEEWSRGGPVGVAGPGAYVGFGTSLRRPFGRVHWAGTETSTYWNGYMDGAVRSGERAAREVLDRL